MSYSIPSLAVVQVTIKARLFGQRVLNTFYYQFTSGAAIVDGAAALLDLNDALAADDDVYAMWRACVSSDVIDIFADLQWVSPTRFVKRTFVVGPLGLLEGTTLTNTAGVITLRSDKADRRSLAHKHLPGLPTNGAIGGILTAGQTGAYDDLANKLVLDVTAGGRVYSPIVYGRARPSYTDKHGVVHPALPESKRLVSTFIIGDTARTMRRRTVGVGE